METKKLIQEIAKHFNLAYSISNTHTKFSNNLDSWVTFQDIEASKL